MQNINAITGAVPTTGLISAQPGVGIEWILEKFASDVWTAAGAPNDVPRMDVGIFDGVNGPAWLLMSGNLKGWNHKGKIYVSNTNYARLRNPVGGANQNLGYSGYIAREFGTGLPQVITDVQTVIAGGNVLVRPPVGEEWVITGIGSSLWVGAPPNAQPQVNVDLTDGVSFARILRGADAAGWYIETKIYLTNAVYMRIVNANGGAPNVICWTGVKLQQHASGQPNVMSQVATVGAGGILTARPTNTDEEWEVGAVGSSVWIGASPAALPDVNVNMTDGTLTTLLARNSDFCTWFSRPEIPIQRAQFLTITDTGGGGGDLGFSAIRTRLRG